MPRFFWDSHSTAKPGTRNRQQLISACLQIRPDDATVLSHTAVSLEEAGDYAGAEPLFLRRALAIDEKALGPDHPDVANSLNNLAGLLEAKGDYAGAEPLMRRALASRGIINSVAQIQIGNVGLLLLQE